MHRNNSKAGMSTVLGTLIFVGILFTSIIPLFMYVNKVNSVYDTVAGEMRRFDQDQETERADIYAYPQKEPNQDKLNIYVKNKSPLPIDIIRVWVNDDLFNVSYETPALSARTFGPVEIVLPTEEGEQASFNIKVATRKGNLFSSLTNTLYYTVGEDSGTWTGGMGFSIQIVIEAEPLGTRFFDITVTGPSDFCYQAEIVKRTHESSCFKIVTVTVSGAYIVNATEKAGGTVIPNTEVTVDTSTPSQWVYGYA